MPENQNTFSQDSSQGLGNPTWQITTYFDIERIETFVFALCLLFREYKIVKSEMNARLKEYSRLENLKNEQGRKKGARVQQLISAWGAVMDKGNELNDIAFDYNEILRDAKKKGIDPLTLEFMHSFPAQFPDPLDYVHLYNPKRGSGKFGAMGEFKSKHPDPNHVKFARMTRKKDGGKFALNYCFAWKPNVEKTPAARTQINTQGNPPDNTLEKTPCCREGAEGEKR